MNYDYLDKEQIINILNDALECVDKQRKEIEKLKKETLSHHTKLIIAKGRQKVLEDRIDKAIEYLKQECLYDGKTYCDDLWCGDIPKLVTILKGSDKE